MSGCLKWFSVWQSHFGAGDTLDRVCEKLTEARSHAVWLQWAQPQHRVTLTDYFGNVIDFSDWEFRQGQCLKKRA